MLLCINGFLTLEYGRTADISCHKVFCSVCQQLCHDVEAFLVDGDELCLSMFVYVCVCVLFKCAFVALPAL